MAERRSHVRRVHGTETDDPWHWLRDRDDPAVREYLEAENAYTETVTAHLAGLREAIFGEIKARTKETHQSLPTPKDGWEYRARTVEGLQYVIHVRRPRGGSDDDEAVLLDENELADGHEYFAVGDLAVSPDHRLLAYTVDTDGDEKYSLAVVEIGGGQVLDGPGRARGGLRPDRSQLRAGVGERQPHAVRRPHRRRPAAQPGDPPCRRHRPRPRCGGPTGRTTSGSGWAWGPHAASGTS